MEGFDDNMTPEEKIQVLLNRSMQVEQQLADMNATFVKDIEVVKFESDQFFLIVIAIIIFFMQCGFAFLEAGAVRYYQVFNSK